MAQEKPIYLDRNDREGHRFHHRFQTASMVLLGTAVRAEEVIEDNCSRITQCRAVGSFHLGIWKSLLNRLERNKGRRRNRLTVAAIQKNIEECLLRARYNYARAAFLALTNKTV